MGNGGFESFTRGEASVILNESTDYWSGSKILHIENKMRSEFKNILAQWNEEYETIGFSYKPVTEEFQDKLNQTSLLSTLKQGSNKNPLIDRFSMTMPKL